MSRAAFARIAFVIAAPMLAGPILRAQRATSDVLPESTYACVDFGGLEAGARAADQMHVAALIRTFLKQVPAATFDQFVGRELDQGTQMLREHLGQLGISPATLRAVLRRPMALGLGRVTVRGMGPSVALVIDEGDARADVDRLVEAVTRMLQGFDAQFRGGAARIGAVEAKTIEHAQGPTILLAREQGLFVATNSEGYLKEILATAAGRQPRLAAASVLGAQRGRLPAPTLASLYLNTGRMLSLLDDHLPYEAVEFGDALGVRSLDGVFAASSAADGGTVETLDFALTGAAQGLCKALFAGPADLGAAALCSSDAVVFGSARCNVPAAVEAFDRLLALLPANVREQVGRQVQRSLRRGLQRAGFTPEQLGDLLAALGGSVSFAVNLGKGAVPIPEVLLFVRVQDPQVVAPWLEQLTAAATQEAGVEWKTRKAGDHEIRFCSVDAGGMALSPSFVVADGYLIASSQTANVVRALRQKDDADSSLAAAEDFTAAARDAAGATSFLHLRAFRAVELGWRPLETWAMPLLDANAEAIGFGREAVPDQEAFAKALGTLTLSGFVDDAGVRLRSRGPLGLGGLLAGGCWLFDEMLARASGRVF